MLALLRRLRTHVHRPLAVAIAKALMIAPEWPVVAVRALDAAVLVAIALVGATLQARLRMQYRLEPVVQHVIALIVAEIVALAVRQALTIAVGGIARLLQLIAIGHDDAAIMFRVLEVVLCQHWVARGLGIAREGEVFLGDVRRSTPDLHIRSVRFKAARKRIVALPVVVPAPATPVLLSLPHCLKGSYPRSTTSTTTRALKHECQLFRARLPGSVPTATPIPCPLTARAIAS